ncbi:nuclear transport factor 2 family protein [Flavobacterium sp.]|uniref:nuclear transport factor 2 family protein n=1 Tax=Flavobacterium sp. TaxID=239 RepID=UPI00286D95A0|nr:nuclear transport factor 2 family protein [Flavobacterium sp.]
MKNTFTLFLTLTTFFCFSQTEETIQINNILDSWHKAAAEARFDDYMNAMTSDAIYIGTDATENWNKKDFMAFAKPYFDKGKAWNFTALERHIYISKDKETAWFDELLNTQMKICRGSGVMIKVSSQWKIQHYVLSMTIPNEVTNQVIKIKESIENPIIEKFKK